MDVVLVILGVLGLGAIIIAAYVFTVAARNYVSSDVQSAGNGPGSTLKHGFVFRDTGDRRRRRADDFPLLINNVVIAKDRRKLSDRRNLA